MSDLFALLSRGSGTFRSDPRFATPVADIPAAPPPEDPRAIAYAEGFAAGVADARAEAEAIAIVEAEARTGLELSLSKLDEQLAESLRLRLEDTIIALCEETLAPLAVDRDALNARIERAVAMFVRADEERVIRLHPDDIGLLAPGMLANWAISPDPSLARGSLRIETDSGGLEDGPEQWRRAIQEALRAC